MQEKMKPKEISESDKNYLLSLSIDDINTTLLKELFAFKAKNPARFLPNDTFTLPKNKLYNKEAIKTTVGRYLFNLFILCPLIIKFIGYQNETYNGRKISGLQNTISRLLLDDKITSEEVFDIYDKMEWLGFNLTKYLNSSLTYDIIVPTDNIEKKKQELMKKYQKAIDDNDIIKISQMEKELLKFSEKEIENVPDKDIYDSEARGSFGNNYKNTSLMRGAIKNIGDNSIHISTSSLVEGIPPEEMSEYADIITQSSYARAVGTRVGGYEGKKLSAGFQSIILDEKDSDCGTKLTNKVEIKGDNKDLFLYRYIVTSKGLEQLTPDNINSYVGKTVNMRSPIYCNSKLFCNKCCGDLFYKLGIKNLGLLTNRIGTVILNQSMKKFHDLTIKTTEVDIEKYID